MNLVSLDWSLPAAHFCFWLRDDWTNRLSRKVTQSGRITHRRLELWRLVGTLRPNASADRVEPKRLWIEHSKSYRLVCKLFKKQLKIRQLFQVKRTDRGVIFPNFKVLMNILRLIQWKLRRKCNPLPLHSLSLWDPLDLASLWPSFICENNWN